MPEPDRRSCDPPLILHIMLLLTLFNGGESEANGLYVQAAVGGNASLPCHVKPAADATDQMVEWSKFDLEPRFVHVRRSGEDHLPDQNLLYKGRTSVPASGLKQGDASLSLSKVRLSDEGKYKCYIPGLNTDTTVQLAVVAAIKITKTKIGVLECESRGWYPEPEVLWLDSEGNPLSAGPPETVRGPDDLYTVSSRVTVDKRHGNSFTCRVQQNSQHREAQMIVPDDFFLESSRSTTSTVIGLIIGLLFILVVGLVWWKSRQTKTKTENDNEPHLNSINQSTDPENQSLMNKGDEVKAEQMTTQNEAEEQCECSGAETELLCQKVKETPLKTDNIPTNRGEHTEERSAGTESLFVMESGQNQEKKGGETMVDMDNKEKRDTETPSPSDKGTCQEQPDQNEDKGNEGQAPSRTMDRKQEDTERESETADSNNGQERKEDAHEESRKAGQNLMDGQQQQDDKRLEGKNDKAKEESKEEGQTTNQGKKGSTEENTHDPTGGDTLGVKDSTGGEIKNNTEVPQGPQILNSSHNEPSSSEGNNVEQMEEEQNRSTNPEDQLLMNKEEQNTIPGTESSFVKKSGQNQEPSGGEMRRDMDNKDTKKTETPGPSDKGTCREQSDQNEDKGNEGQAPLRTMDGKQEDTERESETADSNNGQDRKEDAHEESRKAGQNLMDGQQQQDDKRLEGKNDKAKEENKEEGQTTNQEIKGATEENRHDPTGGDTLGVKDSTGGEIKNNTEVPQGPQILNSSHNEPASPEGNNVEQMEEGQNQSTDDKP